MIIFRPYLPEDLERLALQPAQAFMQPMLKDSSYAKYLAQTDAYTALKGDRVVGCGGFLEFWNGRCQVWALLANDVGNDGMCAIHRAVLRAIDIRPENRIEATCAVDFPAASRWLKLLGFQFEGTMKKYTPDGADSHLFARVK